MNLTTPAFSFALLRKLSKGVKDSIVSKNASAAHPPS
jgi:hypothetical protein